MNPRHGIAALAVVLVGAAAGAYGRWVLWEPYNAIVLPIGIGALLLVVLVLATVPRTRTLALLCAVLAGGLVVGALFGPARPILASSPGTLVITLTAPRATTGSARATCSMDAAATELQLAMDSDVRLDILEDNPSLPADIDQREFSTVSLRVGDRWSGSPGRADEVDLLITVGRVEADAAETIMAADDASDLQLAWTADGGSLAFSGLRVDRRHQDAGEAIDLRGTLEWTC
jgi:hypothetical protein